MATDDRQERPTTAHEVATDPIGTVRVHPEDRLDDPEARRFVKVAHGWWTALTPPHPVRADAPPNEMVATWPRQPLGQLAQVLGHDDGSTIPRPRHVAAHAEHLRAPRTPAHRPRTASSEPRPRTPTFWEEAKVFCRARNAAFALACRWYDECVAATEGTRARPGPSATGPGSPTESCGGCGPSE